MPIELNRPVVICRAINDEQPLITGYSPEQCRDCGREIQVSPDNIATLTKLAGQPICNPCGKTLIKRLQRSAKAALAGATVVLAPAATEQLQEMTDSRSPEELLEKTQTHFPNAELRYVK